MTVDADLDPRAAHDACWQEQRNRRRANGHDSGEEVSALDFTIAATLAGRTPPERPWLIRDWIPRRQVTLLAGDGGTGKSLIAMQLQLATAAAIPWLGLPAMECRSFGLYAEDEGNELHRRLNDIAERRADLPAEAEKWLADGNSGSWHYLQSADELAELWREQGSEIVERHADEAPGTRPARWWQFDAPSPQQRVSGIGTPKSEVLAHAPTYYLGVPSLWIEQWEVEYYTGRAKDINGNPIGQNFAGKHFAGLAIDPKNPPTFESQATFLNRHNLLMPGERRRLRPADFAPEAIAG